MKKLLIFLSLTLILSGCNNTNVKVEPLEYEKQLEELKGQYIKYTCNYVNGWESLSIKPYGCGVNTTAYFNYNERIFYTVIDRIGGSFTNEIMYNDDYYRIFSDKEPEKSYNLNDSDRGTWPRHNIFDNIDRLLTFLAMLNAFEQEEEVVVYNEDSPHWEELADYYTLTMREAESTETYEESSCRVVKIIVTKESEDTIIIKTNEVDCVDDDGVEYPETSEIEVTIGYSEDKFVNTYNGLVKQVKDLEE